MDRERLAAHEAGHAVAAFLLDRIVSMVTLDYAPTGGGASIDKMPPEPLGHRRRPLAQWYEAESDCLVVLAGALSEDLDYDDAPELPQWPQRVVEDVGASDPFPELPPIPVGWQDVDARPDWKERPQSDEDQVHRLTAGIAHSEAERVALELTLRYRAHAMCQSAHFKALHRALKDRLLADGELYADDVRLELQRAELRYLTRTMEANADA